MTPRCPYCNAQGLKHLSINYVGFFAVIFCGQCGAIHGVVPSPAKQHLQQDIPQEQPAPLLSPEETKESEVKHLNLMTPDEPQEVEGKHTDLIAEIGEVDLSKKKPYSPDNMFAYMQAMKLNPGTRYMKMAHDDGPPLCIVHKLEMEKLTIPEGYKNSGRVFWVCPTENCTDWLLAE